MDRDEKNKALMALADEVQSAASGPSYIGRTRLTAGWLRDLAERLRALATHPAEAYSPAPAVGEAVAWQFKDSEWTVWASITRDEYERYLSGEYTGSGNSFEVRALTPHPAPQRPAGVTDAARTLLAEIDRRHDEDGIPEKYIIPWRFVTDLRAALTRAETVEGDRHG